MRPNREHLILSYKQAKRCDRIGNIVQACTGGTSERQPNRARFAMFPLPDLAGRSDPNGCCGGEVRQPTSMRDGVT